MAMQETSRQDWLNQVAPLLTALSATATAVQECGQRHRWEPAQGSEAAEELAEMPDLEEDGDSPIHEARWSCWANLTVAASHLHAIKTIFTADNPNPWSPVAVARAAIESAAQAWWLLQPGLGARERAARVLGQRLLSAREDGKLAALREEALDRIEVLGLACESRNLQVRHGRNDGLLSQIEGHSGRRPTELVTDLFGQLEEETPPGRLAYSWFSGPTHGDAPALMRFMTATLTDNDYPEPMQEINVNFSEGDVIRVVVPPVASVTTTFGLMDRWCGWNDDSWDAHREHIEAKLARYSSMLNEMVRQDGTR